MARNAAGDVLKKKLPIKHWIASHPSSSCGNSFDAHLLANAPIVSVARHEQAQHGVVDNAVTRRICKFCSSKIWLRNCELPVARAAGAPRVPRCSKGHALAAMCARFYRDGVQKLWVDHRLTPSAQ